MRKTSLYSLLLALIVLISLFVWRGDLMLLYLRWQKSNLPTAVKQKDIIRANNFSNVGYLQNNIVVESFDDDNKKIKQKDNKKNIIPEKLNLSVPFTPQAPYADWSMPYQEACEETSVLMTVYYWQDKKFTKVIAKQEIDNMVSWQRKEFGGHHDLNVAQTAKMVNKYFTGFQAEIITDLAIEKIKYYLSQGYPVIVPAAGRELHNPYFSGDGPLYHMLVIKGYTKNKFITNDPGTRRGENYVYNFKVLMNAIHDWTGTAPDGEKIGLTIKPI